ncbi:hypothetical protein HO133_007880 [Letharia lupina]|uniref:Uncharacterized protein n=1 Tax=Letharia lupina TaxID=560253 RepID=A0A8H6CQT0_9LECA|nr:uncharacterized protein HO133_007880 [Letharia lupina]KAF6228150.1 hypothetical protein HO133_007880 [Letharia lupina]
MSRSHRRPSDYSRGSSPRIDRNLAVTEASFQNLGLNETAGAQYQSGPSSYLLPDQRSRRPSYPRSELSSGYLQPDYVSSSYTRAASPASFSALENSTSFGTTLLDPSDYQLFSDTGTFSTRASPFSTSVLGRTDMGSYPYPSDTMTSYRDTSSYGPSRSPSQRGYTNPSTEASLSRSMSGPSGPSILPSSAYGGFRGLEREVARQRQRKLHESRRQSKLLLRRTMLPSTPYARPGEADTESGSIDYLLAHSGSSYDSHSAYGRTPSTSSAQGSYLTGVSSSPYDNPYTTAYGTSGVGSHTMYSSSSQNPSLSTTSSAIYGYRGDRRGSGVPSNMEPVVIETPKKPQCWDHGCNGRQFSTFSNLLRHQREKSGTSSKSVCPRCGAEFTRKTARDGHLAHDKCKARSSSDR